MEIKPRTLQDALEIKARTRKGTDWAEKGQESYDHRYWDSLEEAIISAQDGEYVDSFDGCYTPIGIKKGKELKRYFIKE